MFDYVHFSESDGSTSKYDLLLFTLSTCSFCAEAIEYLENNDLRFRWIATDELPFNVRRKLRNDFIRTFKERLYYPTLVIDGKTILTGFEIEEWREKLEAQDS